MTPCETRKCVSLADYRDRWLILMFYPQDFSLICPTELRPGSVISHYRIEETLGEGGFATVYRAYDSELERHIALKVLKRLDDRAPSIRDEARAAAALNHPNVCTVHSIEDSLGTSMIVMEYLEGRSLAEVIAAGPVAGEEARSICAQMAAGMAAAHQEGIVHGDLKPANVLLTDGGVVKILDFGLAGRHRVANDGDTTLTLDTTPRTTLNGTTVLSLPG